jgi:hypothetical protein
MSSHPQAQVTSDRLLQIAWCFVQPLAIDSAAQNRVFDVLDAGPKTLDEVSKETGASARGLAAVMNLLVGIDLLAKSAEFADAGKRDVFGERKAGLHGRVPASRAVDAGCEFSEAA